MIVIYEFDGLHYMLLYTGRNRIWDHDARTRIGCWPGYRVRMLFAQTSCATAV